MASQVSAVWHTFYHQSARRKLQIAIKKHTQQSLLVRFEISSVRNEFGVSETLSGHFRGRKLIEHRRPIVQNVRQELFSKTASSNMLFGGRLGSIKAKQTKHL